MKVFSEQSMKLTFKVFNVDVEVHRPESKIVRFLKKYIGRPCLAVFTFFKLAGLLLCDTLALLLRPTINKIKRLLGFRVEKK